jgi:hypothetical protein
MPFRPGQSGNPAGRKPGTRTKKTLAAGLAIEAAAAEDKNGRKVIDPWDLLNSIVTSAETNAALRITAATALMPYQYARKATRYVDRPFELPAPTSVEEATANIARLASLAAAKTIALDEMNDLIGAQKSYIEAKIGTDTEAQLAAIKQALRDNPHLSFDLTVLGGLSDLPGTDVLMPPRTLAVTNDRGPSGDDSNGAEP